MAAPPATVPVPIAPVEGPPPPHVPVTPAVNSSLYVGDLDRDVTEQQLFELFSQIGPVGSIRVCRDAVTRRSLGYAYVNYNGSLDPQAATRALDALNFTPLNGKPMRIMWSHRDPSYRKTGLGNIFIKNLDKSIDNKALHDTFSAFGKILSCKVASDITGSSRGYGFVHFDTDEAAQLAINKVNGMMIEEKIVFVGPFMGRDDRPAGRELFSNVFVKNLPVEDTDEDLLKLVSEFGETTSAIVMKDDKQVSKGFGFVNFKEPESAAKCVDTLQGKEYKTKTLYASRAQKKMERQAEQKAKLDEKRNERVQKYLGMNLYIKCLADEIDDDELRSLFSAFGTITSARVMKDANTNKSKGFGFVCFSSHEEATRAVTEMDKTMAKGKQLYVALAQPKAQRRAQTEQQMAALSMQNNPMMPRQAGPMGPGMPFGGPMPFMAAGPGGMPQRPGFFPAPFVGAGPRGMAGPGRGGRGGPGMGYPGQAGQGGYMPNPYGVPQQMMAGPGRGGGRAGPAGPIGGRGGGRFGMLEPPSPIGFQGRGGRGQGRGAPAPARGRGPAGAPPPPPLPTEDAANKPLNAAMLAAATPEQQKTMIGERLFPVVAQLQPELAGKITGMLLEMDNAELLMLLESSEALSEKVDEAIKVLKEHNAIPEGVTIA